MKNLIDGRDLCFVVGMGLLSAGLFMLHAAAGLIRPGAILTAVALFGPRR